MAETDFNVRPGQRWAPPSAQQWNDILGAAREYRQRSQLSPGPRLNTIGQNNVVLLCRNDTSSDLAVGECVEMSEPIFDNSDNLEEFQFHLSVVGITQTSDRLPNFGVAIEPIPDGELGRIAIDGVVVVQLNVTDTAYGYAEPQTIGAKTDLVTCAYGPCKILWQESGTGTGKWAVVRLGTRQDAHHCVVISEPGLSYAANTQIEMLNGDVPGNGGSGAGGSTERYRVYHGPHQTWTVNSNVLEATRAGIWLVGFVASITDLDTQSKGIELRMHDDSVGSDINMMVRANWSGNNGTHPVSACGILPIEEDDDGFTMYTSNISSSGNVVTVNDYRMWCRWVGPLAGELTS